MGSEVILIGGSRSITSGEIVLPAIIVNAGERATERFLEFFAATIRNKNTRTAYTHAIGRFFGWCESDGFALDGVRPVVVATYIEQLQVTHSAPTVKQHLAAIKMLFDWFVVGQVLHDGVGTPPLILLAIEDITARCRVESIIAQQQQWFQVTLSSIGDATIATNANAHITFINPPG